MAVSEHGRGADQVSLRLPDGMRDRIKSVATENSRSMNAEIIATLDEKYPAPQPATVEELEQAIRNIRDLLERGGREGQDERIVELGKLMVERWFERHETPEV